MKNFLVLTLLFIFTGCVHKENKVIAIDVLLVPSEEMYAQALHLNSLIHQNNPDALQLDENHVPHITLLQCFINEKDLPKVIEKLEGLYKTIKEEFLLVENLQYSKDTEESFAMIQLKRTDALMQLHKQSIVLLKPFMVMNGSEKSFVPNPDGKPIKESTVAYVPNFVDQYSYENYVPHISLGVAKTVFLDSVNQTIFKPIPFRAASLSVYQLGDFGTAQKMLWKSE